MSGLLSTAEMLAGVVRSAWRPPAEFPRLRGARRISIDVETRDESMSRGLGPGTRRDARIIGIAVGREDGLRAYLPFGHEGGDNLDPDLVLGWARDELNGFDGEIIGARLSYDLDMLAEIGITMPLIRRFRDVQVAEHLLDADRLGYGLDAISRARGLPGKDEALLREAAAAAGFGGSEKEIKSNLWRLPARHVGAYAEADADRPLKLLAIQEPMLDAQGLLPLWDVECRLTPALVEMTRRGVRIDLAKVERVRAELIRERDRWLAEVRRLAGPGAELMAADSLAPALEARGVRLHRTAKKGQPKIDKELFERAEGDALIDAIAAGRRVQTLISTFIDGHVLGHHVRGRIHATFNQMGASTGRLSSADPNMQNVPKRPSDADERMDLGASVLKLIRGIFVPEEGERWGRQDLSQIEFRYLAHFAVGRGAEEVREAYRRDPRVDFHDQCAIMADLPRDKPNRTRVKNVNFCKCYGGGVDKIAATAGIAREEAAAFVERYDAALPFIMETRRRAERSAQRHGYVTTILLRRQRFDFWEPADGGGGRPLPRAEAEARAHGSDLKRAWTYAALNWKMQGSNADHVKKAIADARESGAWRALGPALLTVHDENNWSVPRTREGTEAFEEVRRIMETCIELSVPVLSESDFGDDWGEAS